MYTSVITESGSVADCAFTTIDSTKSQYILSSESHLTSNMEEVSRLVTMNPSSAVVSTDEL